MTVVIGIPDNGVVWMGADSLSTAGWSGTVMTEGKIRRRTVKFKDGGAGELLLGASGDVRMAQRACWRLKPPTYRPGQDVFEWALGLADRFQSLLSEDKGGRVRNDGSADGRLLLGFQGRVFEISGNYGVVEARSGYAAIGSGCDYALGALFATRGRPARERLQIALRAAGRHDVYVGRPFQVERLDPAPLLAVAPAGEEERDAPASPPLLAVTPSPDVPVEDDDAVAASAELEGPPPG